MTALIRGQNTALSHVPLTIDVAGVTPGTVDLLVFQLDSAEKVRRDDDLIFFNQPTSREGAVRLSGTSTVEVDLPQIPADVQLLRIAVALDDAATGSLALIKGLGVRVCGQDGTRVDAAAIGLTSERAAVLLELYRRGDQWKARNISAGWDRGLAALVIEHGVTVDDPAPPALEPVPTSTPAPARTPAAPTSRQVVLIAYPVKKKFTVRTPAGDSSYDVPSGFEMLHFDLEHMFEVALNGTGIDPENIWWELSFDPTDQVDEYTISKVAFTCRPAYTRDPFGVRITYEEDGMTKRYGYRPDLDFPEWGGGVGTGPCKLHSIAFDLRMWADKAVEEGYRFDGPWMFRFVEDPDSGKLLEAFSAASWTKPKRWRVAPQ